MSGPTSLKTGTLLNWFSLGVHSVIAFLLTPFIVRHLGPAGFGMWVLVQSFSGYYGLVNLGLGSALQRFISFDLAKADARSLRETVATAVVFFSVTGGLAILLAALLARPLAAFFSVGDTAASEFSHTVVFCAVAVAADFFGALTTALLSSRERFDLTNLVSLSHQFLLGGGIVSLLALHPSAETLAFVTCVAAVVSQLLGWRLAKRLFRADTFHPRAATWARLKALLGYGVSTALLSITNLVRLRLGNVVVGKIAGLAATGGFSIASNLVNTMSSVITAATNVLNPRFTQLHTQGRHDELRRLYRAALFVSATLSCWLGLLLFVLGDRFILFWVGDRFESAAPTLQILTGAYVVALAQTPGWNLMFALSRHHFMAQVSFVEALVIVALGVVLSMRFGAPGFAAGIAGSMLVTKVFVQPLYCARIAGLSLRRYLQPVWVPFAAAIALGLAAVVFETEAVLRQHGVLVFLSFAALLSLLFGGIVLFGVRRSDYLPGFVQRTGCHFGLLRRPLAAT